MADTGALAWAPAGPADTEAAVAETGAAPAVLLPTRLLIPSGIVAVPGLPGGRAVAIPPLVSVQPGGGGHRPGRGPR